MSTGLGTLRLGAVFVDELGGAGDSAGAGVIVRLDGREVGVTDASGMLTTSESIGQHVLEAVLPSIAFGTQGVMLTEGQTTDATVLLNDDDDVTEPSDLVLDELINGGLPLDTSSLTLRFVKNETTAPISDLYGVELSAADPAFQPKDLTDLFGVTAAGAVAAIDVSAVTVQLATVLGDVQMRIIASDARGFSYDEVVTFVPGLFRADGELAPPPSNLALPVGGITVHVSFGEGIESTITTDDSGKFQVSQIPAGMLSVHAVIESGGNTYTGWADIAVDTNKQVLVRMLGLVDIIAGVPPWKLGPLDGVSTEQAQVTVTTAGANAPIIGSGTYEVAKGTDSVYLTYEVLTAAYPDLVLQQSRWSDTWQLAVLTGSGVELFSIGRTVNTQLYESPTWNSVGGTGILRQQIDVSALTTDGNIAITVVGITTNIGDDQRPTTVSASLGTGIEPSFSLSNRSAPATNGATARGLVINTITKDKVTPRAPKARSDRYSIPRAGEQNTFPRYFDIEFSNDPVWSHHGVGTVTVKVLDGAGNVLQTIMEWEQVGSSPRLQLLNDTALRVDVTFSDNTRSEILSTPPTTDQIRYQFTLEDIEGLRGPEKESAAFFALWRMPDDFPRYSTRDAGRDDWAAEQTYTWLERNRALVTRINDISGEHARDIGHKSHFEGKDIDMFHVYTFPNGATSGGANYVRLKENVQAALAGGAGAQEALELVDAWASVTRARFDSLIADNDVQRVYYAIGLGYEEQPSLSVGWARALLENGVYTNPNGLVINLVSGAWGNAGNAKMGFDSVHNDHFHVSLRFSGARG